MGQASMRKWFRRAEVVQREYPAEGDRTVRDTALALRRQHRYFRLKRQGCAHLEQGRRWLRVC